MINKKNRGDPTKNFQKKYGEISINDTCPICQETSIIYDPHHDEIFCQKCGLVLYQNKPLDHIFSATSSTPKKKEEGNNEKIKK